MTAAEDVERARRASGPRFAEEDPRLVEAMYVVEATSYEHLALWKEYSAESASNGWGNGTAPWVQINCGWNVQVGELAGLPVCVTLTFARVYGTLILFWEASSRVVDYEMLEVWLRTRVPAYADRHTNAMNFGHALKFCRDRR